ncbi:MAG: amino acid adenylation domain-containing protein, partial [bacterium]|nr:amino acid adenylation domain-containing protein [bacterium]
ERHQVLVEWNHRFASAVAEPLLHRLFEAQADRTPEAEALVFADERLSYRRLEERANQLAHHLQALGIRPELRVGICLERSPAIAVAMLAVLKAGGAYVPLDPSHPPERLAFLLEDAAVEVLISDEGLAAALPADGARRVHLDADADKIAAWSTARPLPLARADNLAYAIYTSGTTGRPKGVMVSHECIARRSAAVAELYGLGPQDRQLQFFALGFDALGEELYPVLATGGAVVFYPHPLERAAAEVLDYAREHRLTKVNLPPAYWHQVVDEMTARDRPVPETLRILTTGGESPSRDKLRLWAARARPGQCYFNVYGPTEGTILVTAEAVPLGPGATLVGERIPIGRPLPEVEIYLVDPQLRPVATGVPGELVIGGVGVARGYLDRPDQTAERFIPNPLSGHPFAGRGSRLYRTGDLARALPDGRIEFVGRTDRQLKIRGHRLEPEEIEAVLARYPGLREAAVVVREDPRRDGDRRLTAYVAPRALEAELAELRSFVRRQLPASMVPAIFVALEALPLAATGKVDLGALPDPEAAPGPATRPHVGPRTPEEEILARIWAEVLGLPRVGVHDDFFELGGDSILSIQIVSRAAQAGLQFTPRQLFDHPTVAELATQAGEVEAVTAEQGPVTGELPLTPIQHWFFEHQLERPHHWNQALLLAARRRLDPARLRRAVAAVLVHHDALRLRFERFGESWHQRVAGLGTAVPFTCVELGGLPENRRRDALERAATQLQASLDLGRGPLLRVACFDFGVGEPERLLLAIHHLAVDGVSWRILLDDLQSAYRQLEEGEALELPPKTTSFKRWAERLVEHARSEALRDEEARWLAAAEEKAPRLPVDFPDGG